MSKKDIQRHQVTTRRPDGFYTVDNEMVTVFAPVIGIYAFGVYHLLKQRAYMKDEEQRAISIEAIAVYMAISKDSAGAAIATLRQAGLVNVYGSGALNKSPRYELEHPKDVVASHPELRIQANAKFTKKLPASHPEIRMRQVGNPQSPQNPQGHPEFRMRVKTSRIRNSGCDVSVIQDGDVPDSGHEHPDFRMPNKEEEVKEGKKIKDITPLPPSRGGGHNPSFDHERQTTPTTGLARAEHSRIDGEPMAAAVPVGCGPANAEAVAKNESRNRQKADRFGGRDRNLDGMSSAGEVLAKLLSSDAAARIVEPDMEAPTEEDVSRDARVLGRWFLQTLRDQFAIAFGAPLAKNRPGWEDPLEAWNRCFDHVSIGDVEVPEGAATGLVVYLLTPKPRDLASGLEKYKTKVQIAMRKAFGREVQLVPRLETA